MDPTKVQPEKNADYDEKGGVGSGSSDDALDFEQGHTQSLSRSLQGRHMQMIAIGTFPPGCVMDCKRAVMIRRC